MKNRHTAIKNLSIRLKMTIWASVVLALIALLSYGIFYTAGSIVLRNTVKSYLISTVEENVNKIRYTQSMNNTDANIYILYGGGLLEIDRDFLDVVNDVYAGLYDESGSLLYGENPIARYTAEHAFEQTYIWNTTVDGVRYNLYDRKLSVDLPDGSVLWIRGAVSERHSMDQLKEISRISLVLMPVVILLCVLSGYLLTGRLLAPIRDMEEAATRISRGDDLKERIPTRDNGDEINRLGRAFNGMLERLEESFEAERQFTSDASHELRTPTSVIMAQTEYILEKDRPAEEYKEAFEVVQRQGVRMRGLIEDMLDYTRLDRRPEDYPMAETDLTEIVRECSAQMALAAEKGIAITATADDGVKIRGNRMLLERMLTNLISNGIRYGKDNGHVNVSLSQTTDGTVLAVTDDGIGISASDREKIFQRFYRGDTSRSTAGTGLGLSMVRKIAEMHGATVAVESEPGQGSTFKIIFH